MGKPVLCIGCGCVVDDGRESETAVPACSKCWRLFLDEMDAAVDGGSKRADGGFELPVGPTTRIAEAMLAAAGYPPRRREVVFTPVRGGRRRPRKGRLPLP